MKKTVFIVYFLFVIAPIYGSTKPFYGESFSEQERSAVNIPAIDEATRLLEEKNFSALYKHIAHKMRASIDTLVFVPVFDTYADSIEDVEQFSSSLHLYFRPPTPLNYIIRRGLRYSLAKEFRNIISGVMVYNKEGSYLTYFLPEWNELISSFGIGNLNQWSTTKFVFSYKGLYLYFILCSERQEIKVIKNQDDEIYSEYPWEAFHDLIAKLWYW